MDAAVRPDNSELMHKPFTGSNTAGDFGVDPRQVIRMHAFRERLVGAPEFSRLDAPHFFMPA